jgi:hypothetical protein
MSEHKFNHKIEHYRNVNSDPSAKCLICERSLGDKLIEWHHLIPKTFGGVITIPIHKICHRKIHATFTDRELEKIYHDPAVIAKHEEMQKFIVWIQKKPANFYDSSITANRKRK